MPYPVYHLLSGGSVHHFKNCLVTATQTCPADWDVKQRPVFWGGQKQEILARLRADRLPFDEEDCVFLTGTLSTLWRWLRQLAGDEGSLMMHGVMTRYIWFLLRTCPALLPRTAWIGWGAGVCGPWLQKQAGMTPLKWFWFRPYLYCVPRLALVSTHDPEDARRLNELVGPITNHSPARYLLQGLPEQFDVRKPAIPIRVCVGHRAGWPDDYQHVFEILRRFAGSPIEVYVPLSYGAIEHVETIIDMGRKMLGECFRPVTQVMALDEYAQFLKTMDVLIMHGSRPQGTFIMTFALTVGTKVFINDEATMLERYRKLDCEVFAVSELSSMEFEQLGTPLAPSVQQLNFDQIWQLQEDDRRGWREIFDRLVPVDYQHQTVVTSTPVT